MEFIKDLWGFIRHRKKFWLIPLIVILIVLGIIIVLSSGSAIGPWIYTLF